MWYEQVVRDRCLALSVLLLVVCVAYDVLGVMVHGLGGAQAGVGARDFASLARAHRMHALNTLNPKNPKP